MIQPVSYSGGNYAETGTVRYIKAVHQLEKLARISYLSFAQSNGKLLLGQ
jgi:hypothetical protein